MEAAGVLPAPLTPLPPGGEEVPEPAAVEVPDPAAAQMVPVRARPPLTWKAWWAVHGQELLRTLVVLAWALLALLLAGLILAMPWASLRA